MRCHCCRSGFVEREPPPSLTMSGARSRHLQLVIPCELAERVPPPLTPDIAQRRGSEDAFSALRERARARRGAKKHLDARHRGGGGLGEESRHCFSSGSTPS